MYKVIWLTKFRSDLEREEVRTWWKGRHAELAAATPGMVRYVQNHWMKPLDPGTHHPNPSGNLGFDGHAEHWFKDRESYEAAMKSDEWRKTVADGPMGFDATTLLGAELMENVVTWEPDSDGRRYGGAENE